jgi:anti-sigma-K factor RskA
MDVKEFIGSGIIELYAMNALSSDDKNELERLMLLHPELLDELKLIEETLEEYALAHSLNPRPHLRENIVNAVKTNGSPVSPHRKVKPTREKGDHSLTYKYLIAASLAALVISTFASWFFYSRWDEAEQRYTDLLNDKNELAENYNLVKLTYDETMSQMILMRDMNSRMYELNSMDTAQHFMARVYWNKDNHQSYIDVLDLPSPDEGRQFQLWAIVGGKPVDAGVFLVGDQGIQRMKDIETAEAWAVTLEPKGGSVSPSQDQMYLKS